MPGSPPEGAVAVVCNDFGGAQTIVPWARERGDAVLFVTGPAARLVERLPGSTGAERAATLDAALDRADWVLTGTGWQTDLEHRARIAARERGLPSVAWLDHWVHYAERFARDGEVVWPDAFWVSDAEAEAEAGRCFSPERVRLVESPFHRAQREELLRVEKGPTTLLLMEPVRADWGRPGPGELQALDHLWATRPPEPPVRLRPHPAEEEGKYDAWIAAHPGVDLDRSPDLVSALKGAGTVYGLESTALVWAGEAGFRVATILPPWAPPCRLPHAFIERPW
ncbi:MAG: hypothetical protein AAGB93_15080 [Planctomycetota bacterium]